MLLVAVTVPVPAGAETVDPPDPVPVFGFKSSDGFKVDGILVGTPERPRLELFVIGLEGAVIYSSFPTEYEENSGAIRSDLGPLGRIDIRFHPTGGRQPPAAGCNEGKTYLGPAGFFEGRIVFRGEQGYTQADVRRAFSDGRFLAKLICPGYSEVRGPGLKGAALIARNKGGGRVVTFEAIKNGPGSQARLSALVSERSHGVRVLRSVGTSAPSTAFRYQPTLSGAVVSPPSPFSGNAIFSDRPSGPRWSGPLSVDFPGRSGVRLAGPSFKASMRHAQYELLRP